MSQDVLFTREPVINKQRAITATRLRIHAGTCAGAVAALDAIGDDWPPARPVFVSLAGCAPDASLADWIAPEGAMMEIAASALADPACAEAARQLAQAGVPLVLSDYKAGTDIPTGMSFRFVMADARVQPTAIRVPGILLATGLSDPTGFDAAVKAGYGGATGWFFKAGQVTAKKLAPAHAQIVRVLNLVRRNADAQQIEAALKQDVALSFKLLRYINSAGFGLMCQVQSFRHAVVILGYEKLNKWLSLLLVTAGKDPSAPALMQAAIARGRLMEVLGQEFFPREEHDNLFITGAFSLLDKLLGTPMEKVLEEMTLPEPISDALLGQDGAYTPFLRLARACEEDSSEALAELTHALGLQPDDVNRAQMSALKFADTLEF
ncbi:MAG: HDOD domain-containing protein [Gammaproteobacteria bacterium]|nr:HDOD domain-containing protein [Gammaproteobacteria bacterium]MBU0771341.1 HDOD domain-containing protein [Gammaproteobacteria bacterium]MBU0857143.1 HDOD domain-containing protein [Gammaproteobacteria bacterium]MBU1848021.1 HDOD domain-containing protein [Gammaproteobacteria bacterium]